MVGTVPILRLNFATHLLGNETDLRYIPHFISFFARVTNIFVLRVLCYKATRFLYKRLYN